MCMKSKYIWYWAKQPWPAIEVDLSATTNEEKSSLNSLSNQREDEEAWERSILPRIVCPDPEPAPG